MGPPTTTTTTTAGGTATPPEQSHMGPPREHGTTKCHQHAPLLKQDPANPTMLLRPCPPTPGCHRGTPGRCTALGLPIGSELAARAAPSPLLPMPPYPHKTATLYVTSGGCNPASPGSQPCQQRGRHRQSSYVVLQTSFPGTAEHCTPHTPPGAASPFTPPSTTTALSASRHKTVRHHPARRSPAGVSNTDNRVLHHRLSQHCVPTHSWQCHP